MQQVKISLETFRSIEKNVPLTLDKASWFTQNEGFIPLPRKSDKQKIKVIFTTLYNYDIWLVLYKEKITKYRFSEVIDENNNIIGFIIVLETKASNNSNKYFVIPDKVFKKMIKNLIITKFFP